MPEFNRLTTAEGLEEGLAEEVAIVPRGAVGRTIAFRKEHPMKTAEILKACADVPLENEAELDKVLKEAGLEGEAAEAAKAIARLAGAYSDKLGGKALATALNATVAKGDEDGERYEFGKAKKQDDDDDDDEKKPNPFGATMKALMKSRKMSASKLAQDTQEDEEELHKLLKGAKSPSSKQLSKIARALGVKVAELNKEAPPMKPNENSPSALLARIAKGDQTVDLTAIEDPEARAALEIFKAEQEIAKAAEVAKDERIEKLEKSLTSEKDLRVMKELTEEVAKKYSYLPGAKVEEVAKTLKTLREKAPEAAAQMEKILEGSNEAIKKGLLGELTGDAFGAGAAANAISRVEMAADVILKSGEKHADGKTITKEQAIDLAIQRNPALYSDYTDEAGIEDGSTH